MIDPKDHQALLELVRATMRAKIADGSAKQRELDELVLVEAELEQWQPSTQAKGSA